MGGGGGTGRDDLQVVGQPEIHMVDWVAEPLGERVRLHVVQENVAALHGVQLWVVHLLGQKTKKEDLISGMWEKWGRHIWKKRGVEDCNLLGLPLQFLNFLLEEVAQGLGCLEVHGIRHVEDEGVFLRGGRARAGGGGGEASEQAGK